jgi:hypothetical protein
MKHFNTYSIRTCPLCDNELTYNGKNHKKTSREAENKQRVCKSCSSAGQSNPMYGKPSWSKGKKRPGHSKWLKENNPMFDQQCRDNYFLSQFGMTAEKWAETKDARYLYILEVLRVTKRQPLHTLENYDKIGRLENGGYAIDHIYPKSKGFDNKIPAELIGDIKNLQIIPGLENSKKREKIIYIPEHIQHYLDML